MNDKLKYGLFGFLIGSVLAWISIMSVLNADNANMMQNRGTQTESPGTKTDIDAHFIEQMIPHHEDAITMAKLAETKAKTAEIKQLSKNIIESQSNEIAQMTDWYKEWFGREISINDQTMIHHGTGNNSTMHMGMMGDETDIASLETADNFDKAFIEEMIPHHQMAIMMANMLKNGTQRPKMRKLAGDIISAQTKEIDQMRELYKDL